VVAGTVVVLLILVVGRGEVGYSARRIPTGLYFLPFENISCSSDRQNFTDVVQADMLGDDLTKVAWCSD